MVSFWDQPLFGKASELNLLIAKGLNVLDMANHGSALERSLL